MTISSEAQIPMSNLVPIGPLLQLMAPHLSNILNPEANVSNAIPSSSSRLPSVSTSTICRPIPHLPTS